MLDGRRGSAGTHVLDQSLVATTVHFDHTRVEGSCITVENGKDSFGAGAELAHRLDPDGLVHVLVLSDGLHVNGTDLVRGLTSELPEGVTATGGLSGDGARFEETVVLWDDVVEKRSIAVLGLYGGRSARGVWIARRMGSVRTRAAHHRSDGNVLYELDGKSALELYKRYLGEHAERAAGHRPAVPAEPRDAAKATRRRAHHPLGRREAIRV